MTSSRRLFLDDCHEETSPLDLVETLRNKIDVLDHGDHTAGLRAVLNHIVVAFRHLERGKSDKDETAFTDAIYRSNQAFEGGVKEAYRVLTNRDPSKKTPFQIEEYLEKHSVFRDRVLNQFKIYRTEWRNPSTHDYKLDFDESEAFLAIVSVSAFSCLLADQIAERISFEKTKAIAPSIEPEAPQGASLFEKSSILLASFVSTDKPEFSADRMTEAQVVGTLHGLFVSAYPNLQLKLEARLSSESGYRADLLVTEGDETIIIEVKRLSRTTSLIRAREQVERFLEVSQLQRALIVFVPDTPEEAELLTHDVEGTNRKIGIVIPKSALNSKNRK